MEEWRGALEMIYHVLYQKEKILCTLVSTILYSFSVEVTCMVGSVCRAASIVPGSPLALGVCISWGDAGLLGVFGSVGADGTAAGDGTGGEGEVGTEAGAGSTGTLRTGSAHSQGTVIIKEWLLQAEIHRESLRTWKHKHSKDRVYYRLWCETLNLCIVIPGMTACLKSSSRRCGRKQSILSHVISHRSE